MAVDFPGQLAFFHFPISSKTFQDNRHHAALPAKNTGAATALAIGGMNASQRLARSQPDDLAHLLARHEFQHVFAGHHNLPLSIQDKHVIQRRAEDRLGQRDVV